MFLLQLTEPFVLESGRELASPVLAYTTLGQLNDRKDNVIWVCHALTANANPQEWWELVGEGRLYDPAKYFIICANMPGSCYGSTGPLSVNETTGQSYYHDFPQVTVRDMVGLLDKLRNHLEINKIHTIIGGSMGGQQAMEWCITQPDVAEHLVLVATNARHSAWGIAYNEAQRMAIKADGTWPEKHPEAGKKGLEAARATALLSYRNYPTYKVTQSDDDLNKTDDFKVIAYQRYQGEKLSKRFNAFSYVVLSKAMDSHNVGRNRKSVEEALGSIRSRTLVIGIRSDMLFPVEEQKLLATYIPGAVYQEIDSAYGHDGFLVEHKLLAACITRFYRSSFETQKKE